MGYVTLLEISHDFIPPDDERLIAWAKQIRSHLRSGDKDILPGGVRRRYRRSSYDPDPLTDYRWKVAVEYRAKATSRKTFRKEYIIVAASGHEAHELAKRRVMNGHPNRQIVLGSIPCVPVPWLVES